MITSPPLTRPDSSDAPADAAGSLPPVGASPPPEADSLRESRHLQVLIEQAGQIRDPKERDQVQDCLRSLVAFYGTGLAHLLQAVQAGGPEGRRAMDRVVADPIARGLLLIHGLHPVDLPTRLQEAIEKVRPYMESHGGNVELLNLENDVATFRLVGACKTCPSSSMTLELALRRAIEEACPDLLGFVVE
jgi:Fe-S cluster biogenesis protein NfuA